MKELGKFAVMLAMAFGVIIVGEIVIPIAGLDRFIVRHESALTAAAIGTTVAGFALFMGGILYRIFSGGERMSHADVEDLSRRMAFERRPAFAQASTFRFKGRSAGLSFHDQFSIKRRAWRESLRWRGNFVIMAGAFLLAFGLFGIFVVIGSNGVKLICGGAIVHAAVRTIVAFARARWIWFLPNLDRLFVGVVQQSNVRTEFKTLLPTAETRWEI